MEKANEIINEFKLYLKDCETNTNVYENYKENISFVCGEQWDETIKRERQKYARPCLVVNKTLSFVNQVVNNILRNMPQPKIRPYRETTEKAENINEINICNIMDGFIKRIFTDIETTNAIKYAIFNQIAGGLGFVRIKTQYLNDKSFEQEIVIDKILDPSSVFVPFHLCEKTDLSDMPYCIIKNYVNKFEAEKLYNEANIEFDEKNLTKTNDKYLIYEYFKKENLKKENIYLLDNGEIISEQEYNILKEQNQQLTVKNVRQINKTIIRWYLVDNKNIIKEAIFPGKYIPIVPFLGLEIYSKNQKKYLSLTDLQKDTQKSYNSFYSAFTESIGLTPLAPFVAEERQVSDYKEIWENANKVPYAVLPYSSVSENGVLLPPPQRNMGSIVNSGVVAALNFATSQFKEVTGIYDASLGASGNETSGRAVIARQKQGDNAIYHFFADVISSIKHIARICLNIIPVLYDTKRYITIKTDDGNYKQILINTNETNDFTKANFDVCVDTGASFETKRQEVTDTLIAIAQAMPSAIQPIMDLYFRNMDFPLAQEIADRMKIIIQQTYPGLIQEKVEAEDINTKAEMQSMVMDMQKLMELHKITLEQNLELKKNIDDLQKKLADKEKELQTKADIAIIRSNAELQRAQLEKENKILSKIIELKTKFPEINLTLNKNNQAGQQGLSNP